MTEYIVTSTFRDSHDTSKHVYREGHTFPHKDSVVLQFKPERIEELMQKGWIAEKEPEIDFETLTVAEIQSELEALGIEYDKKAKKADLINLLEK